MLLQSHEHMNTITAIIGPHFGAYWLIHTCHAAPLPFSNNAVSFVKVRVEPEISEVLILQFNGLVCFW
jgi:hypothetical protein